MNEKVMVRFPQLGRDTILRPAEVMSRKGDTLRVRVKGELRDREVEASETMPVKQAYGMPDATGQQPLPGRAFATANGALSNR